VKNLYLTVEGQTEEAFAGELLQPHLSAFNVFLWPPRFTGPHGRRHGRIPRGGMFQTFRHALEDMRRWLKENQSPDARFSMMVDLYHLPHVEDYDEDLHGPLITYAIGLPRLRERCPHFNGWLTRLEQLDQGGP
jgi:hypothetical protein